MRQRNIKNLNEKLDMNSSFLIDNPKECKGKWSDIFGNDNPVYLEIGCGKGQFIMKQAQEFPKRNFIAIEGQSNVVLRALQKAEVNKCKNLRIFIDYGFIQFKTDNDSLFEFTLEEIDEAGLKIIEQSRDLHSSDFEAKNITTEYEDKFSERGKNINYVKFK